MKTLARLLAFPPLLMLKAYRLLISPMLPAACRFEPTCSCYAQEAITRHGVVKGGMLATKRILRCHPWSESGYDPVPDHKRL